MDYVIDLLISKGMSATANGASIVSLIVSGIVLTTVWQIKRRIAYKVRVPELIKQISDTASRLSSLLADFTNNAKEIAVVIVLLRTTTEALLRQLPLREKKAAKQVSNQLKAMSTSKTPLNIGDAWAVYTNIQGVLEDLRQRIRDRSLE